MNKAKLIELIDNNVTYNKLSNNVLEQFPPIKEQIEFAINNLEITLAQFKKFANDNDILWFYNKPHWRGARYNRIAIDEIIELEIKTEPTPIIDELNKGFGKAMDRAIWKTINNFFNIKREETMKINLEIAKICHQVNREYCINEQLEAPPKWDDLPEYVQESIVAGVAEVIADPKITPTQIHEMWCDYKEKEGWKYALNKDLKLKTHPNLVPFNKLTKAEQGKDVLFIKTVRREMKK